VTQDQYNTDKLGLQFTKQPPRLLHTHVNSYQDAIDWVKGFLAHRGLYVCEAHLDIHTEQWLLYGAGHTLVAIIPHELLERVGTALARKAELPLGEQLPVASR